MRNVDNPYQRDLEFAFNGTKYILPRGVSSWPDDVARHVQHKLAVYGVRCVGGIEKQIPPDVVAKDTIRQPGQNIVRTSTGNPTPEAVEPEGIRAGEQGGEPFTSGFDGAFAPGHVPVDPATPQEQEVIETQPAGVLEAGAMIAGDRKLYARDSAGDFADITQVPTEDQQIHGKVVTEQGVAVGEVQTQTVHVTPSIESLEGRIVDPPSFPVVDDTEPDVDLDDIDDDHDEQDTPTEVVPEQPAGPIAGGKKKAKADRSNRKAKG